MSGRCIAIGLIAAMFSSPFVSYAENLYRAGNVIVGESYNETFKSWMKRDFSLWVYVTDGGKELVILKGDSGLGEVEVPIRYEEIDIEHFHQMLTTAMEWAGIARRNRADTSRALGCLPVFEYVCDPTGMPNGAGQMGLRFWSTNDGERSSLIVDMVDQSNKFKRAKIYFDAAQLPLFINTLKQLEPTMKKARDTRAKQDLFMVPGDKKLKQ